MKLTHAGLAKIFGIITAVIVLITVIVVPNTPFFNLPFFQMFFPETEIEAYQSDSQKMSQEILTDAEQMPEAELKAYEERIGMSMNKVAKIAAKPSINGLSRLAGALSGIETDLYSSEDLGLDRALLDTLSIFKWVLYLFCGVTLLLVLLGIGTKKIAFPIIAIIFSALYFVFLAGIVYYVLFILFAIAQMVFLKKEKRTA